MSSEVSFFVGQTLEALQRNEPGYRARPELNNELFDKTANILVAASAIGKSATKTWIEQSDPTFGNTGTLTSRQRRSDDTDEYEFVEHSDDGLRRAISLITTCRVVQYTIHPTLGYLYLSEPRHYTRPNSLLDMQSQSVSQVQNAPFKHTRVVHLVSAATPWLDRFNQRFPPDHPEHTKRLEESIRSHEWTLQQPDEGNWIVETIDGQAERTAEIVHDIFVTGRPYDNSRGRELAQAQIDAARAVLAVS